MSHWHKYHARWAQIAPPLRPDQDVVEYVRALAGGDAGRVLLLGVTSELADAFEKVYAADKNPAMVANVWPGDTPTKKAVVADWLDLDPSIGPFAAVALMHHRRTCERRAHDHRGPVANETEHTRRVNPFHGPRAGVA